MENFQVILLIVMVVAAIVQHAGKKKKPVTPHEVLADEFPLVEPVAAEGGEPMEAPSPAAVEPRRSRSVRNTAARHAQVPPAVSARPAPASPAGRQARRNAVRLSTREEARRAFIYSQIFDRKYV